MPGSIARRFKYELAVRDSSLDCRTSPKGEVLWARCAECGKLLPLQELTLGHITPLSEGGTNERNNLRLECYDCNHDADQKRCMEFPHKPETIAHRLSETLRQKDLRDPNGEYWRNRRLYDSILVLDIQGNPISYTSRRRIKPLLMAGAIRLVSFDAEGLPGVVQLQREKQVDHADLIPLQNRCVACGSIEFLHFYRFWPEWHPGARQLRKTHRTAADTVCRSCLRTVNDRMLKAMIEACGDVPLPSADEELCRRSAAILLQAFHRRICGLDVHPELAAKVEAHGVGRAATTEELRRAISGLQSERDRLMEQRRTSWRDRVLLSGLDFGNLFWEIVRALAQDSHKPEYGDDPMAGP